MKYFDETDCSFENGSLYERAPQVHLNMVSFLFKNQLDGLNSILQI
jgi:hypothetical protein